MRVLLIHNRYRALGGEERAVSEIADLLARRGHDFELLERSSRDLTRGRAAGSMLRGGLDPDEVAGAVRHLKADVVHAHNVHPLFGWRALAAAQAAGARTVLHLHNFRLFCAIAVAYRDGAPCYRCRERDTLPGLRLRCRGSYTEAAVYAAALHRQQPHLIKHSDRFITVSVAHGNRLHELGLPAEKAVALPNFIRTAQFAQRSVAAEGQFALVAGRLVEEKGYDTAIRATSAAGVPLVIAGEGPDEARLRALAARSEVTFTGLVSAAELAELRRRAGVVLVPSRSEESGSYAVLDAFASGIPVLGSNRGGVGELVGQSAALDPDRPDRWTQALRELWRDPEHRQALGAEVLGQARQHLGEDTYYERLMGIYEGSRSPGPGWTSPDRS